MEKLSKDQMAQMDHGNDHNEDSFRKASPKTSKIQDAMSYGSEIVSKFTNNFERFFYNLGFIIGTYPYHTILTMLAVVSLASIGEFMMIEYCLDLLFIYA